MEIHIREAKPNDVDALSVLAKQTYATAFGHSMAFADLEAHLKNHLSPEKIGESLLKDVFLLTCVEDEIIGFVQFGESHIEQEHIVKTASFVFHPHDKEIRRLYVLAPYQNHGIGSQLMDTALTHSLLATNSNIFLDVWEDNERAQRFYERYGFEKVAEKHFCVDSGVETGVDFVMVRRSRKS
jgi:ribosomal protein S18 acetylase RimI-like enzyme